MRDVASQIARESHFYSTKRILHFDDFLKDCKSGGLALAYYLVIERANYLRPKNDQHPPKSIAALGRSSSPASTMRSGQAPSAALAPP